MDKPTTAQRERQSVGRRQLHRCLAVIIWWFLLVVVFACLLLPFLSFSVALWAILLAYWILTIIGVANFTGLDISPIPVPKVTCVQWFALVVILLLIHTLFVAEAMVWR